MIQPLPIALVLIGSFIGAVGSVVIKKGTNKYSLARLVTSSYLWVGLFLYGLSVVFYVIALRTEELSVVYPLVSTTYIWTTFFSVRFLSEKMNRYKWVGLLGIITGVIIIGFGS
jgi:uncharacterized membrane protein